jgi:hypothetical protein
MSANIIEELLPAEIKQIIFDFLSVPDLLNLCSVCKPFNEFIGQSHDYMKKIWIKFYTFKMKDLESLAESSRNYEKLKVNRVKDFEHFKFLTDLGQSWKKVLIYNCEIKRVEILYNFIESFSDTIEELEISDVETLNNDHRICPIKFPSLKRVHFRNVPSTAIEAFLGHNKNLESAAFDIAQEIDGKMPLDQIIHNFLDYNQKLKHLQLGPHYIKSFFDRENIEMKFEFKLEKLMLKFPIIRDESLDIEANVCEFLKNQPKIDWILFLELQNEAILCTAWNNVKSLNHLTFVGLEGLFDEDMDLAVEPNFNIIHLELLSRKLLLSQLRKLFVAAPNLETLHVHTLTRYVMEFTAKNHQNIRQLTYETHDEEVFDIYEQLKASAVDVNRNIELKKVSFWRDAAGPFSLDPTFWHS